MKYLKILGLAAVAAMAMAAFGASTASATTLFTDSKETVKYATGTTVTGSLVTGTSAVLTSGGSTIATCTSSEVHGKTTNETGTTVTGNIEKLTWGGCSQTTHTVTLGKLHIQYTTTGNGTVTGSGSQVTLTLFGVSCTYGTGEGTHLGNLTGGAAPILKIATTVNKTAGGFLCPSTAGWDAEYVLTAPHALFVGP